MAHDLSNDEVAGAAVYNPLVLAVYDLFVLRLTNNYGWRSTRHSQLDLYNRHMSANHLDIGPGTGWFLKNASLPATGQASITLMDLNATPLKRCEQLLEARGVRARTHVGSVLQPIDAQLGPFDSVGAGFLFHCVPGTWANEKGDSFRNIARVLTDNGTLFGTTVLGKGVRHNLFGRTLMHIYNGRTGIFHNEDDDLKGLVSALQSAFADVDVEVDGVVAKFVAAKPIR